MTTVETPRPVQLLAAVATLAGCLASPPDSVDAPGGDAGGAQGDAGPAGRQIVPSGTASSSESIGGEGGDPYSTLCPDGRLVTGLGGSENGAGMAILYALCGALQITESGDVELVDTVEGEMIVGDPESDRLDPVECSAGLVAVGYGGSKNGNEVVAHLQLDCAPIVWDGNAATVGDPAELTGELGTPEPSGLGNGTCGSGRAAAGLAGGSGLLIDRFQLECFTIEAKQAEEAGLTPAPGRRTSRSCPSP
jgi:hypothetical protein